jgi:holo-ACP synthase
MVPMGEAELEQLLLAREARAERQKALLDKYRMPVMSFTVNIPGLQKNTPLARFVFNEGYSVLIKELNEYGHPAVYHRKRNLSTGMEGYFVADEDEIVLKTHAVRIETQHPLGRLFDIDVIGRNGRHVSRGSLGYPERRCFICDNEAHACARSKAHSIEELLEKIRQIVDEYKVHKRG